ncbi:MAG: hypothetical protein H8F28_22270 [Fibrella sp.]|nr:hypothetical protein [Armatimonadota bacterium]
MKQLGLAQMQYSQDYDEMFILATSDINPTNPAVAPARLYDVTWVSNIQPYVKNTQIFVCPSTKVRNEPDSTPNPDEAGAYLGSITSGTPPSRKGPIWDYGMPGRGKAYSGTVEPYEYENEFDFQTAIYDGVGGYAYGGTGTPRFPELLPCVVDSLTQADIKRPADMVLVVESRSWDHGVFRNGTNGPEYIRTRHLREQGVDIGASNLRPKGWVNTAFADGHAKAFRPETLYRIDTAPDGTKYYRHFYGGY